MKKSVRAALIILALMLTFCAGCSKNSNLIGNADYFKDYIAGYDLNRPIRFEMVFADGTVVTGEMDYYNAPITVGNFIKHCSENYYDGLTIHRVKAGSLIQGGCKKGDGTYREEKTIRGEFSDNGWNNRLQHVRGTMSMARWADEPNSADAQFFIMCKNYYSYDGKYAAFATITDGMGYIESLSNVEADENDKPLEPIVIQTIRILGN